MPITQEGAKIAALPRNWIGKRAGTAGASRARLFEITEDFFGDFSDNPAAVVMVCGLDFVFVGGHG